MAAAAADLGAGHPVGVVLDQLDGRGRHGLGEAGPAAAGVELGVARVERVATRHAAVEPGLLDVGVGPGERPLGAGLAQHLVLGGGQPLLPLVVGVRKGLELGVRLRGGVRHLRRGVGIEVDAQIGERAGKLADHPGPLEAAVAARVLVQVLLVVLLGVEELACGSQLGGDGPLAGVGQSLAEHLERGGGLGLLLVGGHVDRGPVLGAVIVALPVDLGGVVLGEEHLEEAAVRDLLGVVDHEDGLGVAGAAGAGLVVGGVAGEAAGVAHRGGEDAGEPPEDALGTPEAAHPEDGDLVAVGPRRDDGVAVDGVDAADVERGVLVVGKRRFGGDHLGLATAEQHVGYLLGTSGDTGAVSRTDPSTACRAGLVPSTAEVLRRPATGRISPSALPLWP